jgi:hypothetical protein
MSLGSFLVGIDNPTKSCCGAPEPLTARPRSYPEHQPEYCAILNNWVPKGGVLLGPHFGQIEDCKVSTDIGGHLAESRIF